MKQLKFLLPILIAFFTIVSCDNDDDVIIASETTIAATAAEDAELTILVDALTRAGLVNTLNGTNEFTVFAPTNSAFEAFLQANSFATLNDVPTDVLRNVLLNHVVSGTLTSGDLTTGYVNTAAESAATNSPISIFINTSGGVTINNSSTVRTANIDASNGVIHKVDAVIGLPTIVDLAASNSNFSSLAAALQRANLVSTLEGNGPFTVLAPTNDAFAAFLQAKGFATLNDVPVPVLTQILLNHVMSGANLSTGLSNSYESTLATSDASGTNMSIYINTDMGVMFNGVASVIDGGADVIANNGVIHAIDAVIDLPTVVTFATADPNFSTLVTALTSETPATDFAGILSRTMTGNSDNINPDFTVFAPTNDAFQKLLDSNMMWNSLADIDDTTLTNVLLHHVVDEINIRSGDLTPNGNTMATTLEGDMITITLPGTGNNIADVTDGAGNTGIGIIAVDVQANNGVVHALNTVLMPN